MSRLLVILILFCIVFQVACKPKVTPPTHDPSWGSDSSAPLSNPKKAISTFVIKAADNPGLAADVTGSVILDSIKLVFKQGTDVSSLIPTITIVGASVSPASQTPQNFGSDVIYAVTATDGTVFYYRAVAYFH